MPMPCLDATTVEEAVEPQMIIKEVCLLNDVRADDVNNTH